MMARLGFEQRQALLKVFKEAFGYSPAVNYGVVLHDLSKAQIEEPLLREIAYVFRLLSRAADEDACQINEWDMCAIALKLPVNKCTVLINAVQAVANGGRNNAQGAMYIKNAETVRHEKIARQNRRIAAAEKRERRVSVTLCSPGLPKPLPQSAPVNKFLTVSEAKPAPKAILVRKPAVAPKVPWVPQVKKDGRDHLRKRWTVQTTDYFRADNGLNSVGVKARILTVPRLYAYINTINEYEGLEQAKKRLKQYFKVLENKLKEAKREMRLAGYYDA